MTKRVAVAFAVAAALIVAAVLGAFNLRGGRQTEPAPDEDGDRLQASRVSATAPPVSSPPPPVVARAALPQSAPSPAVPRAPRQAGDFRDVGALALVEEPALMDKLRALEGTNPALTLQLARDGNARFPRSPEAPERTWMIVKALTNLERFKEARDEARAMVGRYPGTSWSQDVERHLLSNPLE